MTATALFTIIGAFAAIALFCAWIAFAESRDRRAAEREAVALRARVNTTAFRLRLREAQLRDALDLFAASAPEQAAAWIERQNRSHA